MKTAQVALQFNIGDFDQPIESLLINSSPSHDLAPELVTQGYTAGMVNVGLQGLTLTFETTCPVGQVEIKIHLPHVAGKFR